MVLLWLNFSLIDLDQFQNTVGAGQPGQRKLALMVTTRVTVGFYGLKAFKP